MNSPSTILVASSWFVVDVLSLVTVDVLLETVTKNGLLFRFA
jgi:hypothetical protein